MTAVAAGTGGRAPHEAGDRGELAATRRWRLPYAYVVASAVLPLILLGILALRFATAGPPAGTIGSMAPGFALADLDGNPVRLADLRGHPVIVNFWASWCGPCVEEFPLLQSALDAHRADGLVVVGIVFQDRSEAARAFMARMHATWPASMDAGGAVAAAYGIYAPPESFFIDASGRIAGRQLGQLSRADLERQLTTILAKE
jgi:cytochrome c biogenesis protein CcmG/thiol:disulfide interchange protein DsbE